MSPDEKAQRWLNDLAHQVRTDLAAAEEQLRVAEAELATVTTNAAPGPASMALVSVCIDRAYTALEAGLVRIARILDQTVPIGSDWHGALLHQMTLPLQDKRPAVLSPQSVVVLDILRRHRHWLRHAYASTFDWRELAPTAAAFRPAIVAARSDVERFLAFLASTPSASEPLPP